MTRYSKGQVNTDISTDLLANILKDAYAKVGKLTSEVDTTRKAQLYKDLDAITAELDSNVQSWIKTQVGTHYSIGMEESLKGMVKKGTELQVQNFTKLHTEAIKAISQDLYVHIGDGFKGITNAGRRAIDVATRKEILTKIATGSITGDALKKIQNDVKKTLKEQGLIAMVDKKGKEWDIDRYSKMLAISKLAQANNTGVVNRMLESGYDLVRVSTHWGSCELCRPFENQILSVTGRNPAFKSLDEAIAQGLFHPSCRHVTTPVENPYLEESLVYDTKKGEYVAYSDWGVQKWYQKELPAFIDLAYASEIPTGNIKTVYRAEDSKGAGAVLGEGKYFAFDEENVKRYGSDIREYRLDPRAKMLELTDARRLSAFEDEVRELYADRTAELIDKYGAEKGFPKALSEYARKKGFDGIISDDKAFGSIVFDEKFLLEKVMNPDLYKYERAFNRNDLVELERLRLKNVEDSRFKIHLDFVSIDDVKVNSKKLLDNHKDVIKDLGYDNAVEFYSLLEQGKRDEAKRFVENMRSGNLKEDLQNLVKFL